MQKRAEVSVPGSDVPPILVAYDDAPEREPGVLVTYRIGTGRSGCFYELKGGALTPTDEQSLRIFWNNRFPEAMGGLSDAIVCAINEIIGRHLTR